MVLLPDVRGANCTYSKSAIRDKASPAVKQSPSSGGMTTKDTTTVEIRDNAYWPDEALLADFAQKDDRVEQAEQPLENSPEYATMYFVS